MEQELVEVIEADVDSKEVEIAARVEAVITKRTLELRVKSTTPVQALSTSILKALHDGKRVVLSAIGAQSNVQALKAVAAANGEAAQQGYFLALFPAFETKMVEDRTTHKMTELTVMRNVVLRLPVV